MFLHRAIFPTPVHTFAQASQQNSIDAANRKEYLPLQIEPKSLRNFTAQFRKAQRPNGCRAARLNQEAKKFCGFSLKGRNHLNSVCALNFSSVLCPSSRPKRPGFFLRTSFVRRVVQWRDLASIETRRRSMRPNRPSSASALCPLRYLDVLHPAVSLTHSPVSTAPFVSRRVERSNVATIKHSAPDTQKASR